jgi:hypothetical protein
VNARTVAGVFQGETLAGIPINEGNVDTALVSPFFKGMTSSKNLPICETIKI